jgi:hypothetical protein
MIPRLYIPARTGLYNAIVEHNRRFYGLKHMKSIAVLQYRPRTCVNLFTSSYSPTMKEQSKTECFEVNMKINMLPNARPFYFSAATFQQY